MLAKARGNGQADPPRGGAGLLFCAPFVLR